MRQSSPLLWAGLFSCLWMSSLAGFKELRLPVPTSETIAAVAREMRATSFEESIETDSEPAETGRRVQRKLVTGVEDLGDNMEYQEYQGVMGRPGVDFPVLPSIPSTSFSCRAVRKPGYYADLDTDCQVFHICDGGRKISFLCPNGTIFRQSHLICDWWFRVDCGKSVEQYEESAEQLAADQRIYKERAEAISRAMNKGTQSDVSISSSPQPPPPRREESRQRFRSETRIDAPAFATARQNFENRQNTRKQGSFVRRQQKSQTGTSFDSNQDQNLNQLQYKSSEEIREINTGVEEKEQQVLSETASFASSRGGRFGNQLLQNQFLTPSSQQINSFIPTSVSPSNINLLSQSSPSKSQTESNFQSSQQQQSISTENSYISSQTTPLPFKPNTQQAPVPPSRNLRPEGRLLPTSSQNNNFRPSSSQNNFFRNSKSSNNAQNGRSTKQPTYRTSPNSAINQIGLSTPDISKNEFIQINSLQTPPPLQSNFARPSPDLIPPETSQVSIQNNNFLNTRKQVNTASPNQYNKDNGNFNRNRFSTSTTTRQLFPSSVNSFSSPTTVSPFDETVSQRRQKQRRFTSTTQKPVFTVKFRPSKAFSYVELERTQTTPETTTTPSSVQPITTIQQDFSSPLDNQLSINSSTKEPFTSISSISYEIATSPENRQQSSVNTAEDGQYDTTETYFPENKYETEWAPTRSQTGSDISSYGSSLTTSNSVTKDTQYSSEVTKSSFEDQQSTQQMVSHTNEASRLDKLDSFSNIDPAEINLLPSERKPKSRPDLIIPESSGPNALHTLALYYATSESDSGTTPAYSSGDTLSPQAERDVELRNDNVVPISNSDDVQKIVIVKQKSKVSDEILLRSHSGSPDNESEIDDTQSKVESSDALKDLSSVLTKATKDSYSMLFNETTVEHIHADNKTCTDDDDTYDLDIAKETSPDKELDFKNDAKNDLESEQSRGIVQPTQSAKKTSRLFSSLDDLPDELKLRDSTDLRELAQVFSRALSAYLEDPDSFRRILSEVRPTEPTSSNTQTTTLVLEENDDEVLDFSDASVTGPRLIHNSLNIPRNSEDSINALDIEKINDLAKGENNTKISQDIALPSDSAENTDYQAYTTTNPTSIAVDINLLSRNTNIKNAKALEEESYFPTAGGVDDQSRPRYGGFHNNSVNFDDKPYGSDVSESATGKPITVTTYVTERSTLGTTIDESGGLEFFNNNLSTVSSNQIELESIPDQLGIVPAEAINSLVDHDKDCNIPTHSHESDFDNDNVSFDIQKNNKPSSDEEDIYDRNTGEEKVLVASGSQSFVSRDNIVRLIGSKQNIDYKPNSDKPLNSNQILTQSTQTITQLQSTTPVNNRGSVRFGPPTSADRSDISSFRRRPLKEVTFQNVNLGNGVTLERTKTIRYSTPEIRDIYRSTISPTVPEGGINPLSINEQLGFVSEEVESTTKYPSTQSLRSRNMVRATTYHPSSSQKSDYPDPRGSLRDSWQWNAETSNDLETTKILDNLSGTPPNINSNNTSRSGKDYQSYSFSTFASTLLPPNVTMETAEESMLEQKAEEIFGKLNKTSADMLMNVMNQAESNMTVRRLVLLLVADRNGRERKSYEESRAQLIQALLKTSEKMDDHTSSLEHTTEYQSDNQSNKKSGRTRNRGRNLSTSSTTSFTTTQNTRERGSKIFRDTQPDALTSSSPEQKPEPQYLRSPNLFPSNPSVTFGADPDARAVELLKSLYNLAARWG
uniref:Chitin-binding type-2 domain-containing protein n=2 Tax=Cuerna arida TaxID=1464854 RepID=A0A1B6GN83_9HEMI